MNDFTVEDLQNALEEFWFSCISSNWSPLSKTVNDLVAASSPQ